MHHSPPTVTGRPLSGFRVTHRGTTVVTGSTRPAGPGRPGPDCGPSLVRPDRTAQTAGLELEGDVLKSSQGLEGGIFAEVRTPQCRCGDAESAHLSVGWCVRVCVCVCNAEWVLSCQCPELALSSLPTAACTLSVGTHLRWELFRPRRRLANMKYLQRCLFPSSHLSILRSQSPPLDALSLP